MDLELHLQDTETSDQLRVLFRWLAVMPFILLALLGIGQAGMMSAHVPASADTLSRMHADYSPWAVIAIRPVNPAILEAVVQDLASYSPSGGGVLGMSQGGFWPTPAASATMPAPTQGATPIPSDSRGPTPSGTPVEPSLPTPTPSHTPVPTGTTAPTLTPTRTQTSLPRTPTRTSTQIPSTRTPTRTPTASGKKCSSPPVVTVLEPQSGYTYTTLLPARVIAYDPDNSDPANCSAPGEDGEGITEVIFRWEYWPERNNSIWKEQIHVAYPPFCPFGQGTPCGLMDLTQGWWFSGYETIENGLHSLYLYVGDDEDVWTELEVWFTIEAP